MEPSWECSWRLLGASWRPLGPSGGHFGHLGAIFRRLWALLDRLGGLFGPSWPVLGPSSLPEDSRPKSTGEFPGAPKSSQEPLRNRGFGPLRTVQTPPSTSQNSMSLEAFHYVLRARWWIFLVRGVTHIFTLEHIIASSTTTAITSTTTTKAIITADRDNDRDRGTRAMCNAFSKPHLI